MNSTLREVCTSEYSSSPRNFHKNALNKSQNSERLDFDESLCLFENFDLQELAVLANAIRQKIHGKKSSYLINRYINYSNVCELSCQFCSFAKKRRDPEAFCYSVDEICTMASKAITQGASEVHIVGGLHPDLDKDYYLDMLRGLRKLSKDLHIKAFTAIEIIHLAEKVFRKSTLELLEILRNAGLDSLTGGGAEIFAPEIRRQICRGKESAEEWLEIHRRWHKLGGKSTCTMLYGHIEEAKHRVDHLLRLRDLQDETGGFTGFVPLPFTPENTRLRRKMRGRCTSTERLRILAASRLILDNIQNITAYWVGMGLEMAAIALHYGANDLHGTIEDEKIFHMAGAKTPLGQSRTALCTAISAAGFEPFERDSFYQEIGNN